MTLPLRERRRQETARDIQLATLKLALDQGLENVTTEAIAAAAGVSARTFFNYYPNKESAAVGRPPGFREEDKTALRHGTAPIARDLKLFLDRHMASLIAEEETLRMVRTVVHSNAKALGVLDGYLVSERDEVADCLFERVKDRQIAMALADNAVCCTSRAIHLWEGQQSLPLVEALDMVWEGQIAASRRLSDFEG
ncbi:TetR/AcrR family transcriptional regulator [Amaricoccus macauensis]|uniref:TetR/AcrR family transcriptional regulator n=1 Tax=Amaricoccus macauensis TaxID=57001 RepID=UPI003C7DAA92